MANIEELKDRYIPMSEASFLVLSCLLKENHGYGIMMDAKEMTDGRVTLGSGTIYTLLYKMENDGIIEATREVEKRKLYKITQTGMKLLRVEYDRILQLAKIANNGGELWKE